MRRDDERSYARSPARMVNHQPDRAWRQTGQRGLVLALTTLVVIAAFAGVLLALMKAPSRPALHTLPPTATLSPRDAIWHEVGLSADEQIVFSHSAPQTAYSCGVANKSIVMHVTHNGGTSWQPLTFATPIASEFCTLAVNETNPQQLAVMTLVTKPDPCLTTPCTPTPCASACQPCIDYCPPPPQQTLALYQSTDGGITWRSSAALPNGVHFTLTIAFAGATLYAWTDTWPTLLAASMEGGPLRLIDLRAYFPRPQNSGSSYPSQGSTQLWPVRGQLYVPIPGGNYENQYILTGDGGVSWTRGAFVMDGDPVVLRPASGLDGRTLIGERIHGIGHLVLSVDGCCTWHAAPAPYPDFSHFGQTQCYVAAEGSFYWFNGFDANVGLGG